MSSPLFGSADDFVERDAVRFRVIGVYWAMLALVMKANAYAIHAKKKCYGCCLRFLQ